MALNIDALVATAKRIALSLGVLGTVTYEAFTGFDSATGDPTYDTYNPLTLDVVFAHGTRWIGNATEQQKSTVQLTILQPMTIDDNDRFTFADGTQPKVLNVRAPEIASGRPLTEVWF